MIFNIKISLKTTNNSIYVNNSFVSMRAENSIINLFDIFCQRKNNLFYLKEFICKNCTREKTKNQTNSVVNKRNEMFKK